MHMCMHMCMCMCMHMYMYCVRHFGSRRLFVEYSKFSRAIEKSTCTGGNQFISKCGREIDRADSQSDF